MAELDSPMNDVKPISVKISESLHLKVKGAAALRGTNLEGAYRDALETWLRSGPPIQPEMEGAPSLSALLLTPETDPARYLLDSIAKTQRKAEKDQAYALELLNWLRNPRMDIQKSFCDFVLAEFERERNRKKG